MARPNHLPEIHQEETWLTNQAMERINKRDPERPFFLCLSFNGPHPPWCPPQYFFDLFMNKDIPQPIVGEWARHYAKRGSYPLDVNAWCGKIPAELNHRVRAGYFAYLAYIDAQIGRFVEFLSRCSLLHNAMLVFTSDHGEMLGDHNLWRKVSACDPSARIPFIVRPPRGWTTRANMKDGSMVGLEDIMPTFLDAADIDIPETVEGRSLMPLLKDDTVEWRSHYHHEHAPCYAPDYAYQCITSQAWKYVWNPINGAELLFDRTSDPHEVCDLAPASEYADVLAQWRATLARTLHGRPDDLSDGETLKIGNVPVWREPRKNIRE